MINVARLRKHLNESQPAFAKRFGVNQSTVSRWEAGKVPTGPALILLERLDRERKAAAKPRREAA